MFETECFLRYCGATVGDCINPKCKCLSCFGKNKDTCKILEMQHKKGIDLQRMICSKCKHYNGM